MADIHANPRLAPHVPSAPFVSSPSSQVDYTVAATDRPCTLMFNLGLRGSPDLPLHFMETESMATVIEVLRGHCQVPADAEAQIVFNGEFVTLNVAQYREVESHGRSALLALDAYDLRSFTNQPQVVDKCFHVTWLERTDAGSARPPSSYVSPAGVPVNVHPAPQAANTSNTSTAIDYTKSSPERNVDVRFQSAQNRNATLTLHFEGDEWITDVTDVIRSQWGLAPEDEVWLTVHESRIYGNQDAFGRAQREYRELKEMWQRNTMLPRPGNPQYARDVNRLKWIQQGQGTFGVHVTPFSAHADSASRTSFADTQRPVNDGRKLKFIDGFDQKKLALPFSGNWSIDQVVEALRSEWHFSEQDEVKISVDGHRIVSDAEQYKKLAGKEPIIWAPDMNALMEVGRGRFNAMRLTVSHRRYLQVRLWSGDTHTVPYWGKEKLSTVFDSIRKTHNVPVDMEILLVLNGSRVHWEPEPYEKLLQDLRRQGSNFTPPYTETMDELLTLSAKLQVPFIGAIFRKRADPMYDDMPSLKEGD